MTDTHWSLKLFSGTHLGAEIDLEPGSYTLGRHEDCDFVLTDETLSDQQLEITIKEAVVQLKSLCEHPFSIEGEDVGHECTPEQHQLITTAGLSFAFGLQGKPWPSLTPTTPPPSPKNTSTPQTEIHSTTESVTQKKMQKKVELPEEKVSDTSEARKNKSHWKTLLSFSFKGKGITSGLKLLSYRYRWLLAALTGTGLLALLSVSFFWFWQQTSPENSPKKQVNYLEIAGNIRSQLMLPDLHIHRLADGMILISGYIADNVQKDQLIKQLEQKAVPIKTQFIVMSDMRAAAVQALKASGYAHMQIELDTTPGSLVLSGYAPNAKYVTKIRDVLSTEVPGLLSIVEQVEYQSTREKTLRTMLQEAGLNSQIKLLVQPGNVTLKGRLNDISQGYRFKEVVTNFKEKYGNRPQLSINVTIPSTNISTLRPELTIRSISLGRTPYIILDNGEKYLPGAKLENGYILESIGLDYLVLSLGNQRIKYNVRNNHD